VGAGGEGGEAVIAIGVGDDTDVAGIETAAEVDVEVDGPAGQASLDPVLYPVGVAVLVHPPADGGILEGGRTVPEVDVGDVDSAAGGDVGGVGGGLGPAGLQHLAHPVGAGPQVREAEIAAGVSGGAGLAGV